MRAEVTKRKSPVDAILADLDDDPVDRAGFEGLDAGALLALDGGDRGLIVSALIARLARADEDWRIPKALVELEAAEAVPALRAALRRWSGLGRIAVATALWRLGADASGVLALRAIALDPLSSLRAEAIAALAELRDPAVDSVLWTALEDADALVRSNALAALLARADVSALADQQASVLGLMYVRLASPLSAVRRDAVRDLRAILAALAAGRSPASLGLDAVLDVSRPPCSALLAQLYDSTVAIDVVPLRPLVGLERLWAEQMLLAFLPADARVPGVLAALGWSDPRRARGV
ncbi:MAG: hypothetical protein U1F43_28050 [Myxococcota bacterium]